jgi:non-ribosomal peptide synthetase component F/thioesterase domain-containing protein
MKTNNSKFQQKNEKLNEIEFWIEYLKFYPRDIKFPFNNRRGKSYLGNSGNESFELQLPAINFLHKFSQQHNSTIEILAISLFSVLINKYSDDNDICMFIPHQADNFDINNTSIIRINYNSESFSELFECIHRNIIEVRMHETIAIEDFVDSFNLNLNSYVNVPFRCLFNWLKQPLHNEVSAIDIVSKFDLSFFIWENNNSIQGEIIYNKDIIHTETIVHLKQNFNKLITELSKNQDKELSSISIRSDYELEKLSSFNNTNAPIPNVLAHNFFEKQVDTHPNNTAISYKEEQLNYLDLEVKSNQLANYLQQKGAKPGSVIGICIERSTSLFISVLGVLKAGCCYLPLNPALPINNLEYILEDSGSNILISQNSLLDKFNRNRLNIILIDSDFELISTYPILRPTIQINTQLPCCIIYKIGPTGNPLGVPIHHESIVNVIYSLTKTAEITQSDKLLSIISFSVYNFIFEIFLPLSTGAQIIVATQLEISDIELLSKKISDFDITILQATPDIWGKLIHNDWPGKPNLKAFNSGKTIGASIARNIIPKVDVFWNLYGSPETTFATLFNLTKADQSNLIGKPIENTQIHIISNKGKIQPIGVWGEMLIEGLGVANNYQNNKNQTTKQFGKGFNKKNLFKTGEIARILPNGNFELLGNINNHIKLQGFMIIPEVIEQILCSMDNIKESLVINHITGNDGEKLIALINVTKNFCLNNESIITSLSDQLPDYMIPSDFILMHEFPRNINGEIDKQKLIFDISRSQTLETKTIVPTEGIEKIIYEYWVECLNTSKINSNDVFFNVGGNLQLAIPLLEKINTTFNIELDLKSFYEHPTIHDLSKLVNGIISEQSKHKKNTSHKTIVNIMQIQTNGKKPPFVFVHGDLANYFISEYLGNDQPFYSFFHLGSEGEKIRVKSTEEFAKFYISQLLSINTNGPFLLGGFSYGGIIAYEMAYQLQQMGFYIPFVILLDCNCVTASSPYTLPKHFKKDLSGKMKYFKFKYIRPAYKFIKKHYWNIFFALNISIPIHKRRNVIYAKYFHLSSLYNPNKKYTGELHIFTTTKNDEWRNPYPNWNDFGKAFTIYELEGDHKSILTNHETVSKIQKTIKLIIDNQPLQKQ